MLTTDGSPPNIYLEGIKIEQVQSFKDLGSLVQEKKIAVVVEVQCRIGQATAVFASLKWCLWMKANITITTKMSFPDPDYSDSTLSIRNLDPSKEENRQTWGFSNEMSQANLGGNSAQSTSKRNCTTTMRWSFHDRGGDTEKLLAVVWARVPNGPNPAAMLNYSGADNHQRGRYTAVHWKGPGWSKLKTALKGIVSNSRTPRPYPPIALHWNKLWKMLAPKSVYELRRRIRHNAS